MLLAEGRERFKEDMQTMRLMAPDCGASLGLNVNIGKIVQRGHENSGPGRRLPVQLDLLPLRPSHLASGTPEPSSLITKNMFSWQQQQQPLRNGSWTNSGSGCDDGEVETFSSGGQGGASSPRGIDMNQLPLTTEFDDAVLSSPSSIGMMKREREKMHESFDLERERGACDLSSRGGGGSDDEDGGAASRKKLRLSKEQSALLEESFKHHSTLNPKQKNALAKQLNLRPRQVEVWFQNRRARTKLKQTEVDCELLKRCCETLTIENRRLLKELQELRAIKAAPSRVIAHDFYTPLPAATLTMCPSCERVATVDNRSITFSKPGYSHLSQAPTAC